MQTQVLFYTSMSLFLNVDNSLQERSKKQPKDKIHHYCVNNAADRDPKEENAGVQNNSRSNNPPCFRFFSSTFPFFPITYTFRAEYDKRDRDNKYDWYCNK